MERDIQQIRDELRKSTRKEAEAIVNLAGFDVKYTWELANGYWPDAPDYDSVRKPWWLFMTEIGPVRLGWRKRVLEIDWSACEQYVVVTDDDVTKSETYVHAYSVEKAVEYLRFLRKKVIFTGAIERFDSK